MMVLPGGMLVGDHWDGGDGLARLGIMAREMRFMWANLAVWSGLKGGWRGRRIGVGNGFRGGVWGLMEAGLPGVPI